MQACIDIWRYKSGLINNFPEKKVHIWKRGSVFKLRKQLKRASFAAVLNIIRQKHKKKCSRQPMPPTLYVLWFYLPSFVQKMSHGDPNTLLFIRINGLLYSLNSMITILKPFTSVWKIDLDQLQFGFPIPHLFYFFGASGKRRIYSFCSSGFWDQVSLGFLEVLRKHRGFEETIFSWVFVYKRLKGCKILKWISNWIIRSVKLIQWKGSLHNFLIWQLNLSGQTFQSFFELKNWSILLLIGMILLLGTPRKDWWEWGIFGRPYFDSWGLRS